MRCGRDTVPRVRQSKRTRCRRVFEKMLACTSIPSAPPPRVEYTAGSERVKGSQDVLFMVRRFDELRTGRLATNRFLRVLLMLPEGGLRV